MVTNATGNGSSCQGGSDQWPMLGGLEGHLGPGKSWENGVLIWEDVERSETDMEIYDYKWRFVAGKSVIFFQFKHV